MQAGSARTTRPSRFVRARLAPPSFGRAPPSCRKCSSPSKIFDRQHRAARGHRHGRLGSDARFVWGVRGPRLSGNTKAMAKAVLTFALYQGDALQRRETVTQDIVKVGKDPKTHLRVHDEMASRMHAVIEVAGPEDITLIDLGNEPGTMVNGARVNKC